MSRGFMAVLTWIGVLVVLGLILTHSTAFSQVEGATFSGLSNTIRDLQMLPHSGTHK